MNIFAYVSLQALDHGVNRYNWFLSYSFYDRWFYFQVTGQDEVVSSAFSKAKEPDADVTNIFKALCAHIRSVTVKSECFR